MSDAKALNLSSLVSKKTRRAKARFLQNFVKADRTTDELFEVYQLNFNKQQSTALNLQKNVKHYLHCLKELHEASKGLSQCLLDMHEKEWPKHDVFENNAYEIDHINDDLEEKLKESVLVPLEQYLGQFAEVREKIAKRGRKLVDYDSLRHNYEGMHQTLSTKQQDDSKIVKYRDQLEESRRVYEALNNELHDELPALYDNRLPFIITIFQRLFSSRITYHKDNLNIEKGYLETVELLAKATEKGTLINMKPVGNNNQQAAKQSNFTSASSNHNHGDIAGSNKSQKEPQTNPTVALTSSSNGTSREHKLEPGVTHHGVSDEVMSEGNTLTEVDKPPVYLHKVRATYKYLAEDEDELSFEAGEIIQVIEYDDPAEQEEGWLMGIKESDGQKGLFPANFTKEI